EGLAARAVLVGDVMADLLLQVRDAVADQPPPLPADVTGAAGGYVVATIHRPENTDDPVRLAAVVAALASVDVPVALLAHPRLVTRAAAAGIDLTTGSVRPLPPLSYPGLVSAMLHARGVVTDS